MLAFSSGTPLYVQIAQVLKMRIEAGVLSGRRAVATEQILGQEFGVSRTTVRQALATLKNEGLLQSRRGVGSRGIPQKIQQKIHLTGDPLHGALHDRTRIVSLGEIAAPNAVAEFFGSEPGKPVVRLVRTHYFDGQPLSVVISYLPLSMGKPLSRAMLRQPLHDLLWQRFGLRQDRSVHSVRVGRADSFVAPLLGITLAEPVLRIQSSVFMPDGRPIRWTENFFREDRYEYTAEMRWPRPSGRRAANAAHKGANRRK